jgi:hypothetical protein
MKKKRSFSIRLGPLALSLLAAGVTAVAFAAVSLADNGSGSNGGNGNSNAPQTLQMPGPGGRGVGVMSIQGPNLSAADRQKMEEFRQCMQDNGAPAPPDPSTIDPSKGPPKPPSQADQGKIQKAYEACKDKLPENLQKAGPPRIGTCGPPPGPPPGAPGRQGTEQGNQQNQDQSNSSGTSSGGSSS